MFNWWERRRQNRYLSSIYFRFSSRSPYLRLDLLSKVVFFTFFLIYIWDTRDISVDCGIFAIPEFRSALTKNKHVGRSTFLALIFVPYYNFLKVLYFGTHMAPFYISWGFYLLVPCSVADPGWISDPGSEFFSTRIQGQKDSRIRIRIKELKYFNPNNCF